MAKRIYIGNGTAKNVSSLYIGANNAARKIKKAYIGVSNKSKLFYTAPTVWNRYTTINNSSIETNVLYTFTTELSTYPLSGTNNSTILCGGSESISLTLTENNEICMNGRYGISPMSFSSMLESMREEGESKWIIGDRYVYIGPASGITVQSSYPGIAIVHKPEYLYLPGASLYRFHLTFPNQDAYTVKCGFDRFRNDNDTWNTLVNHKVIVDYTQGDYVDQVISDNENEYPNNGVSNGYWYVKV